MGTQHAYSLARQTTYHNQGEISLIYGARISAPICLGDNMIIKILAGICGIFAIIAFIKLIKEQK